MLCLRMVKQYLYEVLLSLKIKSFSMKKIAQKVLFIFVFLLFIFNFPMVSTANEALVFGFVPAILVYIFSFWLLAVIALWLIFRKV